jgi:glycosyltransferase involved in cell wall biosynthesis
VEVDLVICAIEPSVSVVIPAYRAAATIGRTLDSLLAQTRPPDEILVIDDGSPDDLASALAPYGENVRLVRQPNGGAASARNRGIDLASGNWIAFVDADDYWERPKLERQLAIVRQYPQVGLIAAHFYQQFPNRPRYAIDPPAAMYLDCVLSLHGAEVLTIARRIWTSTVLVRRTLLGAQRFDTSLATAEDVDLWIRLVLAAPVYLLSEPLATALLLAGSLSRSDVAADAFNMLKVVRRHAAVLGKDGVRGEAQVYREWAAGHLGNGEPHEAILPAWNRLTHQPWSMQAWWILCKSTLWAYGEKISPRRTQRTQRKQINKYH